MGSKNNTESYTIKPWALILGGSSGLGLATAKKLAKEGFNVWIIHRDRAAKRDEIQKEFDQIRLDCPNLITQNKDALSTLKMEECIGEMLQAFPKLKLRLVVFSIAKGNLRPLLGNNSLELTDLNLTSESMAFALLSWTKKLIELKLFSCPGSLIAFTSEGSQRSWPGYAAVGAAKAALQSLVRSMALEYAPLGIRCNCIQAGFTITPSSLLIPGSEQIMEESKRRNPYGRLTQAEDVANAVYLLSRDEALWINGTIIPVDGGESTR